MCRPWRRSGDREAILHLLVEVLEPLLGDLDARLGALAGQLDILQIDGLRQQVVRLVLVVPLLHLLVGDRNAGSEGGSRDQRVVDLALLLFDCVAAIELVRRDERGVDDGVVQLLDQQSLLQVRLEPASR